MFRHVFLTSHSKVRMKKIHTKDDYFKCPKLALRTGCTLEAGIFTFKWITELYDINKNKIISSVRLKRSTVQPSNLDKKNVDPTLSMFLPEVAIALRHEFGEKVKETYTFS